MAKLVKVCSSNLIMRPLAHKYKQVPVAIFIPFPRLNANDHHATTRTYVCHFFIYLLI